MAIPASVSKLIDKFLEHGDRYRDPEYKEARLRQEFLDPLMGALGWDIGNTNSYSEAHKEVVAEDALKVEGVSRAPDYAFRIGGNTQYYLEAKKPAVNLKDNPEPALQLRRYAWTKGLTISLLSDFEELAVYDTRVKPAAGDKARKARLHYWTISDYKIKWDEIAALLSKEAILHGSIERLASSKGARTGTAEVDDEFLEDIEGWRLVLARELSKRNPALSISDLNFAVQRTIDRIIFLRICEDRGIERLGRLKEAASGAAVHAKLVGLYKNADNRYNSGLFHFRKEKGRTEDYDTLTPTLLVGDKPLKQIIASLYPPHSPYAFAVLPADILGQVYERFLGRVVSIRGQRVVVEEKPEVRKAGGVYYTPTFVVNYIVKTTLSPHFEGKKVGQVKNVRVLDPACGSGSFLVEAYQYILDWYLDRYTLGKQRETLLRKKNPVIRQLPTGGYRLTTTERKRILIEHVYGVDLDRQAVEVTKLSLLLKVLEGETAESIGNQLSLLDERALPDLGENIKCGNSIIAGDIYRDRTIDLNGLDDYERSRVNPFDWQAEFGTAMNDGGFHAIIGNPPYIPIETMEAYERAYYPTIHSELERKFDTSVVFTLSMLRLLHSNGLLGFISSVAWQTGENFARMRQSIFTRYGVREILNLPFDVFEAAYVDTGVFVLANKRTKGYRTYSFPKKTKLPDLSKIPWLTVPPTMIAAPSYKIVLNPVAQAILNRVSGSKTFTQVGNVTRSTQGLASNMYRASSVRKNGSMAFLASGNVYRYAVDIDEVGYVSVANHPSLTSFYEANPRLLIRRVISRADRLLVAYTDEELVTTKDINPFVITDSSMHPTFFLGIMASALVSYLYTNSSTIAGKDDFRQTTLAELRRIPVPIFDSKNPDHQTLVILVTQMMELARTARNAHSEAQRTAADKQFALFDRQVDAIVEKLYKVTAVESKAIPRLPS